MPGLSRTSAAAGGLLVLIAGAGLVALRRGDLDLGGALLLAVQLLVLIAVGVRHAQARRAERVLRRFEGQVRAALVETRRELRAQADEVRAAAGVAVGGHVDAAAGVLLAAVGEERVERLLRHQELQGQLEDLSKAVSSSSRQLEDALRGRGELSSRMEEVSSRLEQDLRGETQRVEERIAAERRHADRARGVEFRQLESLLDLHAVLRPRAPLPSSRGWAASPDILSTLVRQVFELRPGLVVDCGSGLSTLWTAYALEQLGAGGRVVALEHDEHYAGETRALLASHDLLASAEVRHAPLSRVCLGSEEGLWYDPAALADLRDVGLVFVDGPPESVHDLSRYPAVPLLLELCTDDVRLLLDDADRDGERRTVERWTSEYPLVARRLDGHEKGCCLLSRRT